MSQDRYKVAVIVEGHGEIKAVPRLISRWLIDNGIYDFDVIEPPICAYNCDRIKGNDDTKRKIGIQHFVQTALLAKIKPDAILVIVDADTKYKGDNKNSGRLDCPHNLGPELLMRAKAVASHIPVGVALAYKEYESWFLQILPELQSAGLIALTIQLPTYNSDDDTPRGSKQALEGVWGRKYEETVDQAELTKYLPTTAYQNNPLALRSRSYLHLLTTLERLVSEARN